VVATRAPFVELALSQAAKIGTPRARALANRMVEGVDVLEPEEFFTLSSELDGLYRCSPAAKEEAKARIAEWTLRERERRREQDRVALGVGARARERRTWL
jgi:hypothetical protein